jgi:azurin
MTRLALTVLAATLLFTACPKTVTTDVTGNDDQQMDTLSSQLEELRTRTGLACSESCSLKTRVCDLSKTTCDIAGRATDRAEFQKKCVQAQEECAKFNETCSTCSK